MNENESFHYSITILDEDVLYSYREVCDMCDLEFSSLVEFIDVGLIQPIGDSPEEWRFPANAIKQIRMGQRLKNDLLLNPPGVALALELLEEIDRLQKKLRMFENKN